MVEAQEPQSQASLARCHKRFALLNPGQGEISDDNRRNQGSFRHSVSQKTVMTTSRDVWATHEKSKTG